MEDKKNDEITESTETAEVAETIEPAEEIVIEQLPYNRNEIYTPTVFGVKGFRDSWKECWCGRRTWMNDNYCPGCGQALGMPEAYYDI
jgi:hypothetical protein